MADESHNVVLKVPAQEVQGLSGGYHCEKRGDIAADKDILSTSMEELDDVNKLCGLLHMEWGVSHIFPKQLHQILGQAVGWGTDGVNNGPEGSVVNADRFGCPCTLLWQTVLFTVGSHPSM
jgi:hypothetical protein